MLREWADMIKFEHTIFALPFALSGLLLATDRFPSLSTVLWTIIAFTGARAAAMTLNRLVDARIDRANPRTYDRAIPQGRIGRGKAVAFVALSFAVMILAAAQLPAICLKLAPVAVAWLSFYSYTKRFTWLCHLVLGVSLGGAALGGWAAAGGSFLAPAPWLLALAVSTWVAGFDIIYACQDVAFDRDQGLFSLPANFGIAGALTCSRVLHFCTASLLFALGCALNLGAWYFAGVTLVGVVLIYEHTLVSADDLSKVNAAFFTTNGVISIAAFLAIVIDKAVSMVR
jgi:4-hydroxybenzoate polyprenyltransferase